MRRSLFVGVLVVTGAMVLLGSQAGAQTQADVELVTSSPRLKPMLRVRWNSTPRSALH